MTDPHSTSRQGPYAGYDSIDEAIEALRRARFKVADKAHITGRGLVLIGEILDGHVATGMVLLAPLQTHPNILGVLVIRSVEAVTNVEHPVGLMLGEVSPSEYDWSPGAILDVLERDLSPVP